MTNEHRDHQFFQQNASNVEKHIVTNARALSKMGSLSDRPNTFREERDWIFIGRLSQRSVLYRQYRYLVAVAAVQKYCTGRPHIFPGPLLKVPEDVVNSDETAHTPTGTGSRPGAQHLLSTGSLARQ